MREYIPSDVFEDQEEGGGPFGRVIAKVVNVDREPKFIESPAFGQDYVDLKRCSHGKVVCRLCPHDGRPPLSKKS